MYYNAEGKIIHIGEVVEFDSGFQKREIVIETGTNFVTPVKFEFIKEKTKSLDGFAVDDEVKITFSVRGNEYQGKYYVNLTAWEIERVGEATATATAAPAAPAPAPAEKQELPF